MDERIFRALSKIRHDGPGVRSDSPTLRPFALEDGDGGTWTVFTDGHQLVAVRGAREGVEPYEGKYQLHDKLFPYFSTTYGGGEEHVADFGELAAWLGCPNADKCPACCGSGHAAADADRLLSILHPNMGLLYGVPINRNLLAYTFAYLRAEVLQVIVRADESLPFPAPVFLFVAPTWRVLLMSCREVYGVTDAFPRQAEKVKRAA